MDRLLIFASNTGDGMGGLETIKTSTPLRGLTMQYNVINEITALYMHLLLCSLGFRARIEFVESILFLVMTYFL